MFRETDLNVMPIYTEGFGLTALEATSAGLPMIVSIFIILNTLQTGTYSFMLGHFWDLHFQSTPFAFHRNVICQY